MPGLRAIRRIYAIFFFALFLFFIFSTDFQHLKGYEVSFFLEIDPLTALAGLLTSYTLYKGLALSLIIIIPTLFLGRFFCSWVCPLGILNQWLSHFANKRRPFEEYKINSYRSIYRIKYYILALLLVLSAFGMLQIGLLDPIALIYRSFNISILPAFDKFDAGIYLNDPLFNGGIFISALFLLIILANRFLTRFWCRVLCPLGALLGVCSQWSLLRIHRDVEKCTDCSKCLQFCQGGCDPDNELRVSECHVCMNCIEQCPETALHYGLAKENSSVSKPLDVGKRRLVETMVAGGVLYPMLRSSISAHASPAPTVIRPPGSLAEEEFLARCIKCAACMRVCPTNVLQPALLETGFEGLWTPILINRQGYCEHHCVLCGQVCPTAAIRPISIEEKIGQKPFDEPIRLGTAFFDRGRCLPWAMQTPCIVCEEVCPTTPKAIWYRPTKVKDRHGKITLVKQPFVEPATCIGCGICENKCPVTDKAAIRVTSVGESRSKNNRMLLEEKKVI
ncbi:MAG: 4Fe-4S binding protein [Magnetococcales bacterium]|nr:4Fe-4S binding protein [Magnetococcales bacterium]